jgi:hypothetical protein
VTDPLSSQAERAIASVVEAGCPLCKVELRVHDERACCPCCGDSYVASQDRLEVKQCSEHGRRCEHWEAVWLALPRTDPTQ